MSQSQHTHTYICKVNFNLVSKVLITTFSSAHLWWLPSFCSSRATLYRLAVLEFKGREYINGVSALRLPTEFGQWGGSTDRKLHDGKRGRSVYLFPWLSSWKVTSPSWEVTTPPKVTCSAWLTFPCSGNRSLLLFYFFLNLLLAVLGLRCCTRAFSSCSEWGLLFVAVCGLLIALASLVAEHGL